LPQPPDARLRVTPSIHEPSGTKSAGDITPMPMPASRGVALPTSRDNHRVNGSAFVDDVSLR